jgi:hypothetical protein
VPDAVLGWALAGPVMLAYLALVVTALVQVIRDRRLDGLARDLWIVGIVLLPTLGAIAWFGLGHRTSELRSRLRGIRL